MKFNSQYLALIIMVLLFACQKEDEIKGTPKDIFETWEITNFISVESMYYAKEENNKIAITFSKDGTFLLKLDVNSCSGTCTLSGTDKIEFSELSCSKICCDSDFSNKIKTMLLQVETYSLEEKTLKLNVPSWGWINLELN